MSYGIIYKATNKINSKCYVGQTTRSFRSRMLDHLSRARRKKSNYYFCNAINKYTPEGFSWQILCECSTLDELNEKEMFYIHLYNSFHSGYNMTEGGEGMSGVSLSEEARKKISIAKSGVKLPPRSKEWCEKISKAKTGGKLSEETIAKRTSTRKDKNYIGTRNWKSKQYVIETPVGAEYVVVGLRNFCIKLIDKKFYKSMHLVAQGKRKHHKGYKCRHFNEQLDKHLPYYEG